MGLKDKEKKKVKRKNFRFKDGIIRQQESREAGNQYQATQTRNKCQRYGSELTGKTNENITKIT